VSSAFKFVCAGVSVGTMVEQISLCSTCVSLSLCVCDCALVEMEWNGVKLGTWGLDLEYVERS
jgi:hypothetical protein